MRKVAFLCNPSRRWGDKFLPIQEEIKHSPGFEKEFFLVNPSQSDSTETLLNQALVKGYETIVVAAGDGTLNRALSFLGGKKLLSKITLGILPFGTCNDFAKTMGLKRGEWKPVLESILQEKLRKFKVAKVNRHLFINNSGFGRKAPGSKKSSAFKDIQSLKPIYTKLSWDDKKLEGNFLMMVCANAPYFSDGLHFTLDSDPTDSVLEFFFVGKMNKIRLMTKLFLGKRGKPLLEKSGERAILRINSSKLTMETASPIWIMRDGEMSSDLAAIRQATFELDGDCQFLVP